ncbi:MAG: hypothetical protein VCF07_12890 [Nitrospinota bacterium]
MKNKFLAAALAIGLLVAPMAAYGDGHQIAKETDDLAMIWDLLIVRPGAILYVPAALITSIGKNDMKPIKNTFLRAPYQFAIERPLGRFSD